jgi:hypothetical protein
MTFWDRSYRDDILGLVKHSPRPLIFGNVPTRGLHLQFLRYEYIPFGAGLYYPVKAPHMSKGRILLPKLVAQANALGPVQCLF